MSFARAKRLALPDCRAGEFQEAIALGLAGIFSVLAGKVAIVLRFHFASVVSLNVAAPENPVLAQRRQAMLDCAFEIRIAPQPPRGVNAHPPVTHRLFRLP